MKMTKMFWVMLFVFTPGLALAEGALQVLECEGVTQCDEAGNCAPGGLEVQFEIAPLDVGANGEGQYQISYDEGHFEMQNVTGSGPMVWSEGENDIQTLMPTGQQTLIWHRLGSSEPLSAVVIFLNCQGAG